MTPGADAAVRGVCDLDHDLRSPVPDARRAGPACSCGRWAARYSAAIPRTASPLAAVVLVSLYIAIALPLTGEAPVPVVNLRNANVYLEYQDMVMLGGEWQVEWKRSYNSRASLAGTLAPGWFPPSGSGSF